MCLNRFIKEGAVAVMLVILLANNAVFAQRGRQVASPAQNNPLVDSRDGKTYRTVTIGSQTWMAENLNYTPTSGNSWCYDNSPDSCAKYGRLYDWATAMNISSSCNTQTIANCGTTINTLHKGVCPAGWHLPSEAEWDVLITAVGGSHTAGTKLTSTSGWYYNNGTDEYGFSALSGGSYQYDGFIFSGSEGYWWTATEYSETFAHNLHVIGEAMNSGWTPKIRGYSVRCLRD